MLQISEDLKNFLSNEVLDGLDMSSEYFWSSFEAILNEFGPRNKELLEKRVIMQSQIVSGIDKEEGQFTAILNTKIF